MQSLSCYGTEYGITQQIYQLFAGDLCGDYRHLARRPAGQRSRLRAFAPALTLTLTLTVRSNWPFTSAPIAISSQR